MSITTVTVVANGTRKPIQDYLLTIDMAKELVKMKTCKFMKEYKNE